jgi:hypothetical protein
VILHVKAQLIVDALVMARMSVMDVVKARHQTFSLVHCSLMNNKIHIKATTICINVKYLALLAQLKSVHCNNCSEQSLYWESIVRKVKLLVMAKMSAMDVVEVQHQFRLNFG